MLLRLQDLNPHLSILTFGMDGTGKTRLLLTAPQPISFFGWDRRPEKWWGDYIPDAGMEYNHFISFKQEAPKKGQKEEEMIKFIKEENARRLEDFFALVDREIKSSHSKSICVDNATKLAECNKLAQFGRASKIQPYDYPGLRMSLRRLFELASQANKPFLIATEENELYRRNVGTGIMKSDGDKSFQHGVNVILRMTYDEEGFHAEFKKCSFKHDLVGIVLDNEEISYENILLLVNES